MVIATQQRIQIITEYITKGVARANTAAKKTNDAVVRQQRGYADATKSGRRMRDTIQRNATAQSGFFKTMRMGREQIGQFNKQGYKFNSIGGRMANRFRMATHGARGFRMEMLGVMFFGMMLQKTFSGLIKTSLEWMGVMDVFTMALGILFLPVAGLLLEWALKLLKWVSELTPAQKKLINTFVLMGIAIGGILFVIGSFALGIGSLILAFKFLFSPIGAVLGLLLALAGITVYGMFDNLTKEVEGAGQTIAGFGITGETLNKVKDKIFSIITKVKDTIIENFPLILEKGKEIMTKLLDGIEDNIVEIEGVMESFFTAIGDWITENGSRLIELGARIGWQIAKGIGLTAFKVGEAIGEAGIAGSMRDWRKAGLKLKEPAIGAILGKLTGFQHGGIVPGRLGSPVPILAHAGERITPANRVEGDREGVVLNVTYNIEVSGQEEMERLLRENNLQLVEDVKRLVAI